MTTATPAVHSIANKPFNGWIAQAGTRTRALVAVLQSLRALTGGVLTLIILTKGYRILTGQSREPMMSLVASMGRNAVIVIAASTMALGGSDLHTFFTQNLLQEINYMVTGEKESPVSAIDKNLVLAQVVMSAIDNAQGLDVSTSGSNVTSVGVSSVVGALGVTSPALTAGALLLTYQVGLALFISLGPVFILCLIFKQTEPLFHKWLLYGIGLLFSMAVLSFMVSLVLELNLRIAAGLWAGQAITSFLGVGGSTGLTSQAMLQGGIGLLLTTLLVTAPAAAAQFFGGTLGQFYHQSVLGGGSQSAVAPGGGAPGPYGAGAPNRTETTTPSRPDGGLGGNTRTSMPSQPPADEIRAASAPPPPRALNVDGA
ncbi:type IV secretion system protein [Variovorax sp. J22G21]|uniref:type IV secretion system protein n=1 Tax=Variovorax fucosicus TaxID=3053517 RepID=UPI002574EAF3|nr:MULTISPECIES: type IV secretion system protein [unclassified Variovorax]MDM0040269.1 type IV secretion system protein [Variovorax sp. J22R193]MDM0061642.1 type IV secretion system protein [Variovorax sp. J22G21]